MVFSSFRLVTQLAALATVALVASACDRTTFPLGNVKEETTTYTLQHEKPEPVVYTFQPNQNVPGKSR